MSVLLPLDEIAESGIVTDTDFKYYNRDKTAYITTGAGGFTVTGTFTASGFASGFTVQASTNLANGDAVYISSTTAAGVPIVSVADADASGKLAVFVVTDATILSGAQGSAALSGLSAATLNTVAGSVGAPVYLTTTGTTTNTWTLTAPTANDAAVQIIGRVNVSSATVGQIAYNLFGQTVVRYGSNQLQPGAIHLSPVLTGTGDGANLTVTMSHATQSAEGLDVSNAQITNVRTSGSLIGVKSTVTSLTGSTAGTDHVCYDAIVVAGEATADHIALRVGAGTNFAIDTRACASGEGRWIMVDGAANALTIEDALGQDFLKIATTSDAMTFGNATTNPAYTFLGIGTMTTGPLSVGGEMSSPMTAAQVVAGSGTITLPTTGINKAVSSASAVTGIILTAGTVAGQMIYLMNVNAADAITFDATPATSRVALASASIVAGTGRFFSWNATTSLWYPNTV
tara:strand:- start:636 stop:2009 length:1374 start_codon:yes stop_codon:yes gene_type:complete